MGANVARAEEPTGTAGLSARLGGALTRAGGEERLLMALIIVSAGVHLLVLLAGSFSWTRSKPPLADEWEMDADLVTDLDNGAPRQSALPRAVKAPVAKAPQELLPQLPKKFVVPEASKPEDVVAEKPVKTPPPKAPPAPAPPKPAEPVKIKTDAVDANKIKASEVLKRAALERLRLEEKTAKTAEAPALDKLARIAEELNKKTKVNSGFASSFSKGKARQYGALLKRAVRQNYSLPEAYNLKGVHIKVAISITVSERGDLMGLSVNESSGDPSFDALTMQAVKASVPLPKPPEELAGQPILLVFTP